MSFNVGLDATLTILVSGGQLFTQRLTSFEAKQLTKDLQSTRIDGDNDYRYVGQGWDVDMTYDRVNSQIDDYVAAAEAGQYAGQPPPKISVTQTIRNADDGAIAKYRYTRVALKQDSAGKYAGDDKVEGKLTGKASRKVKVL